MNNSFSLVFKEWIDKKTKNQIEIIDKFCLDIGINPSDWFYNEHLGKYIGQYNEDDILKELLENFIFYIETSFSRLLIPYLPKDKVKKNYYDEEYVFDFDLDLELKGKKTNNIQLLAKNKKSFKEYRKIMKLSDREELMKNKLFFYVATQTNIKIFSKKEIRYLKIKELNKFNGQK